MDERTARLPQAHWATALLALAAIAAVVGVTGPVATVATTTRSPAASVSASAGATADLQAGR